MPFKYCRTASLPAKLKRSLLPHFSTQSETLVSHHLLFAELKTLKSLNIALCPRIVFAVVTESLRRLEDRDGWAKKMQQPR